jgi:hypothetical protein
MMRLPNDFRLPTVHSCLFLLTFCRDRKVELIIPILQMKLRGVEQEAEAELWPGPQLLSLFLCSDGASVLGKLFLQSLRAAWFTEHEECS